jgi:nucleotide-binding universal stress UspA family protein
MSDVNSSSSSVPSAVAEHPSRTWVIGSDGSDCAQHAASWAVQHAPGRAQTIRIATAWNVPTVPALAPMGPAAPTWDVRAVEQAATTSAEAAARRVRAGLGLDGDGTSNGHDAIQVETDVREGPTSSVLIDAAHEAAFLVLGSRGLGGFSRLVLGSTSTQCATHAPVPTAIIPHEAPVRAAERVVVAFDGSDNSMTALRWAMGFVDPEAVIDCVMVWDVTPIVVGADQFFFPEANDLARDRFDHLVDQVVADVTMAQPGLAQPQIERHFVEGRPRTELSRVADDADLLVMGARGHGAIGSAILGSVSTWLLHQVERPMVVIPHPVDDDNVQESV